MNYNDISQVKKCQCEEAANLFKTLSNPLRLEIFCVLSGGEKSVSDLQKLTSGSQSQISQFLKRMEYEGLVIGRREGTFKFYSLADKRVKELMVALAIIFQEK